MKLTKKKQIELYKQDIIRFKREKTKIWNEIRDINREIDSLDWLSVELDDLESNRESLYDEVENYKKMIFEHEDKIKQLMIVCGLKCGFQHDINKCEKKDQSKCVFIGYINLKTFNDGS